MDMSNDEQLVKKKKWLKEFILPSWNSCTKKSFDIILCY